MVNINNLTVGQVVDPSELRAKPAPNPAQEIPVDNTRTEISRDSYSIKNGPKSAPVPDVKVGLFDKVFVQFKDVYQSTDNVKSFVAFQKAMDSNPDGFLKAGSSDTGKVTDLQKKLKLLGFNVAVNGKFGESTEKAVINFKKSVGINDGFLTKNGQFSVSSIVTPETWGVLNSNVSPRLNKGENITTGTYVPPVTADELNWAKGLQDKIKKFDYPPTKAEAERYTNIVKRVNEGNQVRQNMGVDTQKEGPSTSELAWAKNFLTAVKSNHVPTPAETAKYNDIRNKQQQAKANANSNQVSETELNWAKNMADKVKGGYDPTESETAKYNNISARLKAAQEKPAVTETAPTPAEPAKTTAKDGPVTKEEIDWALDLQDRTNNKKYEPTQEEVDRFDNISERLKKYGEPTEGTPTEIAKPDDATQEVEQAAPVKADTDSNHGATVEVFGKIGRAMEDWKVKHPSKPFPREHVFYADTNGKLVSQIEVNQASKGNKNYISNLGIVGSVAMYIPNLSAEKAGNYSFMNGKIYNQGTVDQTVDLRVDTPAKSQKPAGKPQPQRAEVAPQDQVEQPVTAAKPQGSTKPVTQSELVWAKGLEDKVNNQSYDPSKEEIDRYNDISARAKKQAGEKPTEQGAEVVDTSAIQDGNAGQVQSGNVSINADPNNTELAAALALLDKIQQGYTPTSQEMDAYEQIIAKNQVVPATP